MTKTLSLAREVALAKLPDLASARRKSLYREHGTLAEKMCLHGLTDDESARLAVVRDELDRIEMAEMAPTLARLEERLATWNALRDEVLELLAATARETP